MAFHPMYLDSSSLLAKQNLTATMDIQRVKKYLENPVNVRNLEFSFTTLLYLEVLVFLIIEGYV